MRTSERHAHFYEPFSVVPAIKVQLTFEGRIGALPVPTSPVVDEGPEGPRSGHVLPHRCSCAGERKDELGREGPRLLCDVLDNVSGYPWVGQERPELAPTTTLSEAPSSSG
jgi:hypothetical protein